MQVSRDSCGPPGVVETHRVLLDWCISNRNPLSSLLQTGRGLPARLSARSCLIMHKDPGPVLPHANELGLLVTVSEMAASLRFAEHSS